MDSAFRFGAVRQLSNNCRSIPAEKRLPCRRSRAFGCKRKETKASDLTEKQTLLLLLFWGEGRANVCLQGHWEKLLKSYPPNHRKPRAHPRVAHYLPLGKTRSWACLLSHLWELPKVRSQSSLQPGGATCPSPGLHFATLLTRDPASSLGPSRGRSLLETRS